MHERRPRYEEFLEAKAAAKPVAKKVTAKPVKAAKKPVVSKTAKAK